VYLHLNKTTEYTGLIGWLVKELKLISSTISLKCELLSSSSVKFCQTEKKVFVYKKLKLETHQNCDVHQIKINILIKNI